MKSKDKGQMTKDKGQMTNNTFHFCLANSALAFTQNSSNSAKV